jgi:hypothetical protein
MSGNRAWAESISTLPAPADVEEITMERRITVRSLVASHPTAPVLELDASLIAEARGDDPFGGLIPVYDDDIVIESDDWWASTESELPTRPANRMVPSLVMEQHDLLALPHDPRHGFVLCQIDGTRNVAEIADVCQLLDGEALDILVELAALGAIELV